MPHAGNNRSTGQSGGQDQVRLWPLSAQHLVHQKGLNGQSQLGGQAVEVVHPDARHAPFAGIEHQGHLGMPDPHIEAILFCQPTQIFNAQYGRRRILGWIRQHGPLKKQQQEAKHEL